MSVPCPKCQCPIPANVTHCPNCGEPKPPPLQAPPVQLPDQDQVANEEVKSVGRFGAIITALIMGLGCTVIFAGAVLSMITGCCGSCLSGLSNSPPKPTPDNPAEQYIVPGIIFIVVMWIILAIIIFVIRGRKARK